MSQDELEMHVQKDSHMSEATEMVKSEMARQPIEVNHTIPVCTAWPMTLSGVIDGKSQLY